jgi:hypothetical protein
MMREKGNGQGQGAGNWAGKLGLRVGAPGRAIRRALLFFCLLPSAFCLLAAEAAAQTHVLIVSGLGGEKKFTDRFRQMGSSLSTAMKARFGVPDANIAWVGEDTTFRDPHYKGLSTRPAVEREFAAIGARAKAGEQVVVFLIGHGAGSDAESRISLPGPDITVSDVQRLLGALSSQRVALVNLTSGSGDFMAALALPGRVVITATKTSYERNESRFGEQFVNALAQDVADVDKDARVSLLEAYRYAVRETKRIYDDATKLQTEHSQLDDNGSKQNMADPTGRDGQGLLARRFFFDARATSGTADARIAGLYNERFELEVQMDSLRAKKKAMDCPSYEAEIERVLISLARKAREIRQAEGRP